MHVERTADGESDVISGSGASGSLPDAPKMLKMPIATMSVNRTARVRSVRRSPAPWRLTESRLLCLRFHSGSTDHTNYTRLRRWVPPNEKWAELFDILRRNHSA